MVRGRSTRADHDPPRPEETAEQIRLQGLKLPAEPPEHRILNVEPELPERQRVHVQTPGAVLDYGWQWDLGDDSIVDHSVSVTGSRQHGLIVDGVRERNGLVSAWIWGGVVGADYDVNCHIVTAAGRQNDRSLRILVRRR